MTMAVDRTVSLPHHDRYERGADGCRASNLLLGSMLLRVVSKEGVIHSVGFSHSRRTSKSGPLSVRPRPLTK